MNGAVGNENGANAQDQNPDLLHWRANVLLDEMMLGAIDIAADESSPARAMAAARNQRSLPAANGTAESLMANRYVAEDESGNTAAEQYQWAARRVAHTVDTNPASPHDDEVPTRAAVMRTTVAGASRFVEPPASPKTNPMTNPVTNRTSTTGNGSGNTPGNGTEQWLFAAEQRYEQLATRRQATSAANATYEYDGWSAAPDYAGEAADQALRVAVPKYPAPVDAQAVPVGALNPAAVNSPTVRSKRSNLLPRMSTADARTIQQEMGMLQSAIEEVLPAGHESRERSQHLLQKAHAILQRDPNRSAEVDYYLQQVRTIVQRVQETAHWSNLYHRRLRTYLLGWVVLSVLVILGRFLYESQLLAWSSAFSQGGGQSLFAYNLLTGISAFFAGALGGAVGAFLNMYSHAHREHGFFDRKYGLRGLILPLIGAGVGLLLCLIFGIGYYLLGVEPSEQLLLGLLPAFLALIFGALQEYLYGVRS